MEKDLLHGWQSRSSGCAGCRQYDSCQGITVAGVSDLLAFALPCFVLSSNIAAFHNNVLTVPASLRSAVLC